MMNAEIRTQIEKAANEAADIFRARLRASLGLDTHRSEPVWSRVVQTKKKGAVKSDGLPIQLCPVPGCKERAAPVFGMVCGKHKNISKATIAKYRAARKAKKKAA